MVLPLPNRGVGCQVDPRVPPQANGVLTGVSPIRFRSVTDGLSQTMLLAERAMTPIRELDQDVYAQFGDWYSGLPGDSLFTAHYPPNGITKFHFPVTAAASSMHPGGVHVVFCDGSARFVSDTIDSWPLDKTLEPLGADYEPAGWWSNVPQAGVWQALATRNGSELVPSAINAD